MKIRVLVVDDEALARERAIQLLKNDSQIEVIGQCGDGQTAVQKILDDKPDLVLLDVQMPELDGHEATRRLRAGAAGELNRRTRVVALTAGALAEERAACLTAGMDDFIAKSFAKKA